MTSKFAIFRRESAGGYSSRGPVALEMTLDEARWEMTRLKKRYPHQDFVIMGEVEEPAESERADILAPERHAEAMNGHSI
jgi:hypothetical protein